MKQANLFESPGARPRGLEHEDNVIAPSDEARLLAEIRALPLGAAQYKEWTAKRRIASYGGRYDFSESELLPAGPMPAFLRALCDELAAWAGLPAEEFTHALVAEYAPGTQLGWHRDVREFEAVIGLSLAGRARMRFRPYPPAPGARTAFALDLLPRSAYALTGDARWRWQHAISPTKELRYSITFRTLRRGAAG